MSKDKEEDDIDAAENQLDEEGIWGARDNTHAPESETSYSSAPEERAQTERSFNRQHWTLTGEAIANVDPEIKLAIARPKLATPTPLNAVDTLLSGEDWHIAPTRIEEETKSVISDNVSVCIEHRKYLSPLRSKHYDGLRSSFLSPAASSPDPSLSAQSRSPSIGSHLNLAETTRGGAQSPSTETIRWITLEKISEQLFGSSGRNAFGLPTCLVVSGVLAIGTSKGFILIFDYHQICKQVIGTSTRAPESGAISAIALSADHTFVVAGHSQGDIFCWDLANPNQPACNILATSRGDSGNKSGHLLGNAISHLRFVGASHSAFVASDVSGMVFYHSATRRLLFSSIASVRVLGRYPAALDTSMGNASLVLASAGLPLGNTVHPTDELGIHAILTPYKVNQKFSSLDAKLRSLLYYP